MTGSTMEQAAVADLGVVHATFTIERTYDDAPPARVFRAFSDPAIKRRWFVEGEGWEVEEYLSDFRVGGREFSRFRFQGGPEIVNETSYQDIVPERRIIIAYWMAIGGQRISVSLATMEFEPVGGGTRLVFTEQGAYLDGLSTVEDREEGTRGLLECLDRELSRVATGP
jgi:uncharacterized protein YndB with AHSA1/START domain